MTWVRFPRPKTVKVRENGRAKRRETQPPKRSVGAPEHLASVPRLAPEILR